MAADTAIPPAAPPLPQDPETISLALSGGGFRATLFHLGVIRYLHSTQKLQKVTHIASVSGGSVLAGHLATNWSRYTGSAKDFEEVSKEILRFTARDVRGRIVRRLPWLVLWLMLRRFLPLPRVLRGLPPQSTTDLLIGQLRRLYRSTDLADLAASPRFFFVATNLTHPGITTFENDSVLTRPLSGEPAVPFEGASVPVHLAVACSAAYPAFFPPLEVCYEDLEISEDFGRQFFSDGGVTDNQGLQAILEAAAPADLVIISDAASAKVDSQPSARFGLFTSGLRAMEMMMAQIRRDHYAKLLARPDRPSTGLKTINIDPESVDLKRESRATVYKQLPHVRTDLDAFDEVEQCELVHHGFFSAKEELRWQSVEGGVGPTKPSRLPPSKAARHLSSRFRFRLRAFHRRDWVAWINVAIVLIALVLVALKLPQLQSIATQLVALATTQDLLNRQPDPAPGRPPLAITRIPDVGKRPSNPGFTVIAEERLWDLTRLSWAKDRTVTGSAFMTKNTELRRDSTATHYTYWFETSGTLRVWLTGRDSRLSMTLFGPPDDAPLSVTNGAAKVRAYKGVVDCRNVPPGQPFLVITQAEYIDSFKTRDNWWVGMAILDDMERAAMRIIFPLQMPFHTPSFRQYPNDSALESTTADGTALTFRKDGPELLWKVSLPLKGSTYRVNWDW